MNENANVINMDSLSQSGTAMLRNVRLCAVLLQRAMERPAHLPGMVCFYGPSGWGKSFSAAYSANKHRAYYVECKSSWTKKALLGAILNEMGLPQTGTLYEMTDMIAEQLVLSQRPLIIDEMDHIVDKKAVEIIRDVYEGSNAPILMIGEEMLPAKLRRWERFHNRMLAWQPAQPADLDDARQLARIYCDKVKVADDLLDMFVKATRGCTRRICVNLYQAETLGVATGLERIDMKTWGDRPIYTGDAPKRRV